MYCGNTSDRGWSNLGGQSLDRATSRGGFRGCGGPESHSLSEGRNPFEALGREGPGQGMGQGCNQSRGQMFEQGRNAGDQSSGGNRGQSHESAYGSTFDFLRNLANFLDGPQGGSQGFEPADEEPSNVRGSEPMAMRGQAADASQEAQATDSVQGGNVQSADDYAQHLNNERARHGLPPLRRNAQLDQAAQAHAQDLQGRRLGHTGSDGSSVGDRASRAGYDFRTIAENVASGQRSNAEVTRDWMNSPGHRRAMLDPNSTEFGFARVGDKFVLVMGSR